MKVSTLLLLACTAVLAAGARADTPEELVRNPQEFSQKVTATIKNAFSELTESAQQARQWLLDNVDVAKQRLAWLKEQLVELWKQQSAV